MEWVLDSYKFGNSVDAKLNLSTKLLCIRQCSCMAAVDEINHFIDEFAHFIDGFAHFIDEFAHFVDGPTRAPFAASQLLQIVLTKSSLDKLLHPQYRRFVDVIAYFHRQSTIDGVPLTEHHRRVPSTIAIDHCHQSLSSTNCLTFHQQIAQFLSPVNYHEQERQVYQPTSHH